MFVPLALSIGAASALKASIAGPADFNVTSLGAIGNGCPLGSTNYTLNSEKNVVTVTFSELYAKAGPAIAADSNRNICKLALGLSIPAGFTFDIAHVDYKAYYQLESKVAASQSSFYHFEGDLVQAQARSQLVGPLEGREYTFRDMFDPITPVLAPCGQNTVLRAETEVRVSNLANPQGHGYLATNSVNSSLTTTFTLNWQTCI